MYIKRISLLKPAIPFFLIFAFAACSPKQEAPKVGAPDMVMENSPIDLGYTNVPNWLQFPPPEHPDWEWDGVVAGVGVDSRGNVYVSHRGDSAPRLTVWNEDGSFQRIFPGPETVRPHMVNIDKDDNVWWVDDGGHCIYKMTQDGEILLTLGEFGVAGSDEYHFAYCTDVAIGPNGELYISDGDSGGPNRRVVKLDRDQKYVTEWGSKGQELGQFDYPHSIYVNSEGTVFVCDRNNYRIQVFDPDGKQEANWTHIGRPYKIVQNAEGDYFVSDGFAGRITKFKRDGTVIGFLECGKEDGERGGLKNSHSLAICPNGDLITGTYQGWVERWKAPE